MESSRRDFIVGSAAVTCATLAGGRVAAAEHGSVSGLTLPPGRIFEGMRGAYSARHLTTIA